MSVTVVSCYYKFPSKHSFHEYDSWMNNFLFNIDCNLIIFTSTDLKDYITNKRINFINNTKIICQNIEDNELYIKYKDEWDYQESIDNQKHTGRNKFCYIIWNSKLIYLKKAIDLNPFKSNKFVWTDIGCLRNNTIINKIKKYPKYKNIHSNKLDIVLLNPFSNLQQDFFQDEIHFAGAQFGSHYTVILKIYQLFYQTFDQFIKNKKFIGCDQQTFASIYLKNQTLFNPIIPTNSFCDIWFYLWQHYSQ